MRSTVRCYQPRERWKSYRAVASLDAHTHYSREIIADLPRHIARIPLVSVAFERSVGKFNEREGRVLDFSRGWWHPPVSPRGVFDSESEQIERRFDLAALVSVTDHNDIRAGLDLQDLYANCRAPISCEWTVPYGEGCFHIGIHNLPVHSAREWFARLNAFTTRTSGESLANLLADLNGIREALIVFCHPLWDLAGVGHDERVRQLRRFLAAHRRQIHAVELNGYRPREENAGVRALALTAHLPLISGGDRHGCAPNAILNVTRARSFAEFAVEVRGGASEVVMMPEYRQNLTSRKLAAASDILRALQRILRRPRQLDRSRYVGTRRQHPSAVVSLARRGPFVGSLVGAGPPVHGEPHGASSPWSSTRIRRKANVMKMPRIALFSDSYHEVNGVARTVFAIEACAKRRKVPLLSVHAGPETRLVHDGSIARLDLKRSSVLSFNLEHDLRFDPSMWRHFGRVAETLKWFAPDVLHFTGPSDVGQLGACLGHRLSIPMVASWHTNLHEYASRRLRLTWASQVRRDEARAWVERHALRLLMLFYRIPRVVLAPNRELAGLLESRTGKPTILMSRGVNTDVFTPARRRGPNSIVNIGYVGRLSPEKNVRLLQAVESELDAEGLDVRFTIVGDGSEREWLRRHMLRTEFTGVLQGDALADAYAQMDVFAFPSQTDTVGNVVLEAMASGVPAVVMAAGGQRFMVNDGQTAIVAAHRDAFIQGVRALVKDRRRRELMGVAARKLAVDLLSWDCIFDDVCSAYEVAMTAAERGSQDLLLTSCS